MTETDNQPDERAEMRNFQLAMLQSESLRNLVIASAGKEGTQYGEVGKKATQMNYINALQNPDEHTGRILGSPLLRGAVNALENERDIYEDTGSVTPAALLRNATGAYFGALSKVKVSDVLGLIGIENVHYGNISAEQQKMYMEDFKATNKSMYNALTSSYITSIQNQGVAKAIAENDVMERKGLEQILQTNPAETQRQQEQRQGQTE